LRARAGGSWPGTHFSEASHRKSAKIIAAAAWLPSLRITCHSRRCLLRAQAFSCARAGAQYAGVKALAFAMPSAAILTTIPTFTIPLSVHTNVDCAPCLIAVPLPQLVLQLPWPQCTRRCYAAPAIESSPPCQPSLQSSPPCQPSLQAVTQTNTGRQTAEPPAPTVLAAAEAIALPDAATLLPAQPLPCATATSARHRPMRSTPTPAPALHVYLLRCLIFRLLRLSRLIRFLRHCGG
jgi:hypothetical protein